MATSAGAAASPRVAHAQGGAGAERYEVTITPPKRPGSESAPSMEAAPVAPTTGGDVLGEPADRPNAGSASPSSATNSNASAEANRSPAEPVAAKVNPNLPLRSLQVGAFRQSSGAEGLRDKLSATFPDVVVEEVTSGGDPLYRVYVGRMPHGAELDAIRGRLVAAGTPAFEVAAPATSPNH